MGKSEHEAPGIGDLPAEVIKRITQLYTKECTELLNNHLAVGYFPNVWRVRETDFN